MRAGLPPLGQHYTAAAPTTTAPTSDSRSAPPPTQVLARQIGVRRAPAPLQQYRMAGQTYKNLVKAVRDRFKSHPTLRSYNGQDILRLAKLEQTTRLPQAVVAAQAGFIQHPDVQYNAKRYALHGNNIDIVFGVRNGVIADARLADDALTAAILGVQAPPVVAPPAQPSVNEQVSSTPSSETASTSSTPVSASDDQGGSAPPSMTQEPGENFSVAWPETSGSAGVSALMFFPAFDIGSSQESNEDVSDDVRSVDAEQPAQAEFDVGTIGLTSFAQFPGSDEGSGSMSSFATGSGSAAASDAGSGRLISTSPMASDAASCETDFASEGTSSPGSFFGVSFPGSLPPPAASPMRHPPGSGLQWQLLQSPAGSETPSIPDELIDNPACISIDAITNEASARMVVANFKNRLLDRDNPYRMDDTERDQFVSAYRSLYHDEDDPEIGQKYYADVCAHVEGLVEAHPELNGIPVEELVALREWTGDMLWKITQDLLLHEITPATWYQLPTKLPSMQYVSLVEGLALVKAIVSGLNALPESYAYRGTVYTGEDQSAEWAERYQQGNVLTDWRFFATAKTEDGKWQGRNVNWETESVDGKNIEIFSYKQEEREVLFPPGTQYRVNAVTRTSGIHPDFPNVDIRMQQLRE